MESGDDMTVVTSQSVNIASNVIELESSNTVNINSENVNLWGKNGVFLKASDGVNNVFASYAESQIDGLGRVYNDTIAIGYPAGMLQLKGKAVIKNLETENAQFVPTERFAVLNRNRSAYVFEINVEVPNNEIFYFSTPSMEFQPKKVFRILNYDETEEVLGIANGNVTIAADLFTLTTSDTSSEILKVDNYAEKLTSRIKDIEIQPLNEFIIKRNDDSATTPNVVNITDDIVALQTSIFDLTASDKITIKSITADATGEIKIDSSNKIILVSEDDIDIHTKNNNENKTGRNFCYIGYNRYS